MIVYEERYGVNNGYAKGLIIDEERDTSRHENAMRILEDLYGEGYVSEFNAAVYRADARQNGRGERENRGATDRRAGGKLKASREVDAKRLEVASDSAGNSLTPEQQAYFVNSKVRDENGKLLVVYHGTPNGNFTVFRTDDGAFFTGDKEYARLYTGNGEEAIPRICGGDPRIAFVVTAASLYSPHTQG